MHISQLPDKYARNIQHHAAQLPDDDYHNNIIRAAYDIMTGYGKEVEACWEYVTQFMSGATLWRDRETGKTKIREAYKL